jgi:zinc/manganese transport system substrate-binding protein
VKWISALIVFWTCAAGLWGAPLQVVTTTEDLAALAREVGGDRVEAVSLAKGYQDPHFVEAKPSFLVKMRKADLFVQVGLELEVAWAPGLLNNARNPRILPGNAGFLSVSEGCEVLQKPEGPVDRSHGDVHPEGNPHLWTDPENGRLMARNIAKKLSELRPESAAEFQSRLADFERRLDQALAGWRARLKPYQGVRVVTYHNSWPNFAKRFDLEVVDYVEPKPGVPPSPQHVQKLTARMRAERIPVLLMETYFDDRLPRRIAAEAGAELLLFPASVGAEPEIKTYIDLFDRTVGRLADALKRKGA